MQLELGLAQRAGGLELQKERYEAIRHRHRRGALAFLAYYTSIRNEDRTTLTRFRENVRVSIANVSPRELARSFELRLNGEWPTDSGGIADILRAEQCNSPIDIYETVVDLIQEVVRQDELGWLRGDILYLCRELKIPDFRLLKARIQLGDESLDLSTLPVRKRDQGDALLRGDLVKAVRTERESSGTVIDPWRTIYSALALGHGTTSTRRTSRSPKRMLAAAVSAKVPDATLAHAAFIKSAFNLSGLPSFRGLLDFAITTQPVPNQPAYQFHIASINSSLIGTEDLSAQCAPAVREHILSLGLGAGTEYWNRYTFGTLAHSELLLFGRAVDLANSGHHDEAADLLDSLVENTASLPLRSMAVMLLLRCLTASGTKTRIVGLVAREVANQSISLDSPTLIEALRGIHFSDVKSAGYPLAGIIALDAKRRIVDDDKLASEIRFATKAFLRSTEQRRPSLLIDGAARASTQLVYFLRNVCVPSVLDMTGLFRSSEEVLEERQAICAVLNTVDPANAEQYEAETLAIVHNRRISAGLQIVNKNRVHVDVETITRSAARNFAEDFERYKDLQRAGIGVAENYDEVLREVMNAARHSKLVVFAPENEADTTLVGLVAGIRDEFLNSSNGGLDFFLSKRIRHQSFVGLVRGPLEFEHLVTTRETATSDYRVNDHWMNKFDDIGSTDREAIEEAFRKLATAFDELVFDVKDRLFHVRSTERPDGMFDVPLTSMVRTY